jgi:hypothetical protein
MSKIMLAQRQVKDGTGDGWIETTKEVIEFFNPNGGVLGPKDPGYFIHTNIKVCTYGKKDEIIAKMEMSSHEKMHGRADGIIEGQVG